VAENIIAAGIDFAKNAFAVHGSRRSCDGVKACQGGRAKNLRHAW